MAQVLEWYQCKVCGRRHRWRADIAGTEVVCPCGKMVLCPELEAFTPTSGADDTLIDPGASSSKARTLDAAEPFVDGPADIDLRMEGASPAAGLRHTRVKGLFGMGRTGEFIFWSLMFALGFTAIVFAAVVVDWYYIALAAVWGPFSFWKWRKAERRWQGNRSFGRAVHETIGD